MPSSFQTMPSSFLVVLEHSNRSADAPQNRGRALARVVEAHPALVPLLDYCATDPAQIALAVGMVYAGEEDGQDDLDEIDLGPSEWFEPSAGLAAVQRARLAIESNPAGIAAVVYDPALYAQDILADLEAIEQVLTAALQQETRFHFLQSA